MGAERLSHRKNDLAGGRNYSISLDVVEHAVGISLLIRVETVQIHSLQQRLVAQSRHRKIIDSRTGSVAQVLDLHFEIGRLHLVGPDGIDVFHHQAPHGQTRCLRGALQHLHIQVVVGGGDVVRKLADLIDLTVVSVLVGHGEHLVGTQLRAQRYIAQRGIERILRRCQQSRALHLLIVAAPLETVDSQRLQRLGNGRDRPRPGILVLDGRQQIVRRIGRIRQRRIRRPEIIGHIFVLAKVHESHQIARLIVIIALVGDPHLHPRDAHTRSHMRQTGCEPVIILAKKVSQKKMSVLIIGIGVHRKVRGLRPALGIHRTRLRILLRHKGRGRQLAELEFGLEAEKRRGAAYQRRSGGHGHVAGFHQLHYIVLLALVRKLQILRVEIKRGVGVVAHVEFKPVAHRRAYSSLYLLVEIKIRLPARIQSQSRIVGLVALHAHRQLHRTLCLQLHAARTENLLQRSERKIHVENIKRLLGLVIGKQIGIALAVIGFHRPAQLPVLILRSGQHERSHQIGFAKPRVNDIIACDRIILGHSGDVRRIRQVCRKLLLHKSLIIHRHRWLHRKPRGRRVAHRWHRHRRGGRRQLRRHILCLHTRKIP